MYFSFLSCHASALLIQPALTIKARRGTPLLMKSSAAGSKAEGAALGAQPGLEELKALRHTSAPFAGPWWGAASHRGFWKQPVAAWQGSEHPKE